MAVRQLPAFEDFADRPVDGGIEDRIAAAEEGSEVDAFGAVVELALIDGHARRAQTAAAHREPTTLAWIALTTAKI